MQFLNFFSRKTPYSPHQFALWRILFGGFLTIYLLKLLPYIVELYSDMGIYAKAPISMFPGNVFALSRAPEVVLIATIMMTICALCITVGYRRRLAALVLWYFSACLFNLNPLTEDPSLPYVGLLLVLLSLIPSGEPWSVDRRKQSIQNWYMPTPAYFAALLALGAGYSLSGFDKFNATGFFTGDAVYYLLQLPIAFDSWIQALLLMQPMWMIQILTWGIAGSMLLALPLLLYWRTRPYMWMVLFIIFVGALCLFDLTQVILGILIFKLFLFDHRWVPGTRTESQPILHFDTRCNLCQAYVKFSKAEDILGRLQYESIYKRIPSEQPAGTIILSLGEKEYQQSDAVLMHWQVLGGLWKLLAIVGKYIPKKWRDYLYGIVARNRYHWFGTCDCT